jgi:2-polyprenyl-6-methoxyphenol hydroxylase-like FAD-dependent oxidoreductase
MLDTLIAAGYLSPALPVVSGEEHVFVVRDGDTPAGRVLWRRPLPVRYTNWSLLWRALRKQVADSSYREGAIATIEDIDDTGATISAGTSGRMRFDLVIGADGYASTVRQRIAPESVPFLPGYGCWRGTYPEDLLPDGATDALKPGAMMVCFPGGHAMIYLIPDHLRTGRRLINWGLYISRSWRTRSRSSPTAAPPPSGIPFLPDTDVREPRSVTRSQPSAGLSAVHWRKIRPIGARCPRRISRRGARPHWVRYHTTNQRLPQEPLPQRGPRRRLEVVGGLPGSGLAGLNVPQVMWQCAVPAS